VVVVVAAADEPAGSAQMIERLKHWLHQLILRGYELLLLRVIVGIVGFVVAGLTVALAIPRVHHLRYELL
jgi:mannitol-specific phosphotransferase system IIBC component